MRKLAILTITIIAFTVTGCEELENLCGISQEDLGFTEDYNNFLNASIYMYQQADRALRDSTLEADGTATIDGAACTRTTDSVIVDFGNGTVGGDGKTRFGSYRIFYTGDYRLPGASASLTLKNYQEGDDAYSGGLTVTNTTPSPGSDPELSVTVNDLTVDTLQLSGNVGAKWASGFETEMIEDDNFELSGGLTLTELNSGDNFVGTIITPLNIDAACDYTFVGGEVDLVPSNAQYPQVGMDFIDGDCANLFTVFLDCDGNQLSFQYPIK